MTDILTRIDQTLLYYSTGLDAEIVVPVERSDVEALVARFAAELGAAFLAAFSNTMRQLPHVDARRRWVYRRWNDPLARTAAWRRKATRAVR